MSKAWAGKPCRGGRALGGSSLSSMGGMRKMEALLDGQGRKALLLALRAFGLKLSGRDASARASLKLFARRRQALIRASKRPRDLGWILDVEVWASAIRAVEMWAGPPWIEDQPELLEVKRSFALSSLCRWLSQRPSKHGFGPQWSSAGSGGLPWKVAAKAGRSGSLEKRLNWASSAFGVGLEEMGRGWVHEWVSEAMEEMERGRRAPQPPGWMLKGDPMAEAALESVSLSILFGSVWDPDEKRLGAARTAFSLVATRIGLKPSSAGALACLGMGAEASCLAGAWLARGGASAQELAPFLEEARKGREPWLLSELCYLESALLDRELAGSSKTGLVSRL